MRHIATFALAGLALAASSVGVAAGSATTRAPANLRAGPGVDFSVVTAIPAHVVVSVGKSSGSWRHVSWDGHVGYLSARLLADGPTRSSRTRRSEADESPVVYGRPRAAPVLNPYCDFGYDPFCGNDYIGFDDSAWYGGYGYGGYGYGGTGGYAGGRRFGGGGHGFGGGHGGFGGGHGGFGGGHGGFGGGHGGFGGGGHGGGGHGGGHGR